MELSEKLKCLRKKMGLSQLALSEKLHVSRQAVSSWEAGTSRPSTESLKSLGTLYDVPLEYLLNDNAPESIRAELEPGKEETSSVNEVKKKNRNIVLILILVGIVIVSLGGILFGSKDEDSIPMEKIKGSDVVIVDEFEIDW